MLTLAALASTVRHQRACCYSATLSAGARSHWSSLTRATQLYRLRGAPCICLTCRRVWDISWGWDNLDETVWLVSLLSCFVCGTLTECQPACLASAPLPITRQPHGASASVFICVSSCVFPLGRAARSNAFVCCVAVQGVNGHYKKVTVWGRKDSIVYRHSPCSWRWTTMVSSLSLRSCISAYVVYVHSEVLYEVKNPTRILTRDLHSVIYSVSNVGGPHRDWSISCSALIPQSNKFWNMHWIEPR